MIASALTVVALLIAPPPPAADEPQVAPRRPRAAAAGPAFPPLAPPPGRILHLTGGTIGQYDAIDHYSAALGSELSPVGDSMWMDIPGTRSWTKNLAALEERLAVLATQGRMLNLTVAFDHGRIEGFGTAADREYAETYQHDVKVAELAAVVRDSKVPTFLRIGGEVNGSWEGHHPFIFPKAFRKFAAQVRSAGATNVAITWCVEPNGDPAIDARNAAGEYRWFPGDDVIDWYGVDPFQAEAFERGKPAQGRRNSEGQRARIVEKLCAMARAANKPVIIGETSPFQHDILRPEDDTRGLHARRAWEGWFTPFLEFLDRHPEVQAVAILSVDWSATKPYHDWGVGVIQNHPYVLDRWRDELRRERWIHLPELRGDATVRSRRN
jgi:hypothetical protein